MRVLIFVRYYLPSYKAGGPLKSLQGLVDYLGEDIEFCIVTSDRDSTDVAPFDNVEIGRWTKHGPSNVFYTKQVNRKAMAEILQDKTWDLLYLQSFFSPRFTITPLLWWKLGLLKAQQVLVATRGEFSPGAIRLKSTKKRAFLRLAKWLGLYKGVYWQASSEREKMDILREIPLLASPERIFIASDIPPKPSPNKRSGVPSNFGKNGRLRVLHLSRVSKMKNLEFALQVLSELSFPMEFNIFGPIGDPGYWQKCNQLMQSLPKNIIAKYHGPVTPDKVPDKFATHDVFFLPTRGENFGHVVFESLQSGCPVLLSDQTPWQDLGQKKVGWVLPLDDMEEFRKVLVASNAESRSDRNNRRAACIAYAENFVSGGEIVSQNLRMFESLD